MNEQNLIPKTTLSKEEAKRLGSKGGKASVKARKERAIISSLYLKTLEKKIKVTINGEETQLTGEAVLLRRLQKIYAQGSDRDVIAIAKEIREATEGNKVQVSGSVIETNYDDLTDEQRTALRAANETLLKAGL